ncbi:hypothetical protein Goari_019327 [Gossypium aridum]|uniref:Uncharacterized protein n=1 Tax=Gossypium aridum TaxID=34290 RepID=A0A7J8WSD2_GOSAI|nr:hypothetical protein [Gossypium aridum]
MRRGYSYIDGVEQLLQDLKQNNYEMHAFTNYPIWYRIIEDKLNISKYLSWTFCSCMYGMFKDLVSLQLEYFFRTEGSLSGMQEDDFLALFFLRKETVALGKRKPDPDFYLAVVEHLKVDPASCIFVDDRIKNVEAAVGVGITGLQFKNSDLLRQDLLRLGVDIAIDAQ